MCVEGRVLDAVAVDLADVEVLFHFGDVARGDAVGCAPDPGWGGGVLFDDDLVRTVVSGQVTFSVSLLSQGGVRGLSRFPRVGGR